MNMRINIRRIVFLSLWLLAAAAVVVLLIAAMHSRSAQVCNGVEVVIDVPEGSQKFLNRTDILKVIGNKNGKQLKGRSLKSIDLNSIEARLEREAWVKDAELYFDNNGMLKVKVTERLPVARVFTPRGESFYIDTSGRKLPVVARVAARLPVFTGYPFPLKKSAPGERKLLDQMKRLSLFINSDAFWSAQIAQVDITPTRDFEVVPTIGNHIIELGDANDIDDKFHRLMIFYRQVLAHTGMEKYERIKVQYDRQIVGVKKEDNN